MARRKPNQHDLRREPTSPVRTEGLDPGAFVGRKPERQAESIPGGIGPKDERIAAVATQTGDPPPDPGVAQAPEGHREGTPATDDVIREAGQNR